MEPITCSNCGHAFEDDGSGSCPVCGEGTGAGSSAAGPVATGTGNGTGAGSPPPSGPRNTVPFEDTTQPFFSRMFRTIGMAFSDPMTLFSGMPSGDFGLPLLYGVIIGTIVGAVSTVWNLMFGGLGMLFDRMNAEDFALGTGLYFLILLLSPVLALIGLFVSAALYHVGLLILGGGHRGFSTTFRAVAYGNTPGLLGIVPLCGGVAGAVWILVLVIIGLKVGHGTEWWKAILAYFLPMIACCILVTGIFVSFGMLGFLSELG